MIDYPLLSALLAPLLLPLAVYTRTVTPKLPEPEGARSGRIGNHPKGSEEGALSLMVLGDSAAAGVGVAHQSQALSGQMVSSLSENTLLEWHLEAESGLRSAQVLQRLEKMTPFKVDVVVVSLGVNDVTGGVSAKNWIRNLVQIRAILVESFSAQQVIFSSVPPMGAFPALPQPLRWYLGKKAALFNQHLQALAQTQQDLCYLGVDFPTGPEYIASDGFHPSHVAYAHWSRLVVLEIESGHFARV